MSEISPKRRTRQEAAKRIREVHGIPCMPSSLAQHATYGTGPLYRLIFSRAFYLDSDIDAWVASQVGKPIRLAAEARSRRARETVA